ncbi:MAG: type II secretion system protein [Methylophilus sp.]|nr:type II secretion system protein [Methylophilus sp.]
MLKFYLSLPLHHVAQPRHGFLRYGDLAKPFARCLGKAKCQQGFSLLELLVVIGLLGIVALGTTTLLVDDGDWKRELETEQRWDAIRKAIIGEPNLSLNGSPYVSGYVADMGRLPLSVSELIERNVMFDSDGDFVDDTLCGFDHDNNAGTADIPIQQPVFTEIAIPNYIIAPPPVDYTNTVSGGWRGPYLYTASSSFYGDGWFNQNTGDACDFDWNVITTPVNLVNLTDITDLRIQSLGSDRNVGGEETAQDYPLNNLNMVNENEWSLGTAPITFNVQFNRAVQATDLPTPTNPLQLKIYRYVDDGNAAADAGDIDETVADNTFILTTALSVAPAQTVTLTSLPIGRFAAVVWCTQNDNLPSATADYTNDVVYDGDCDGGNINHSPVYFTINNATSQVTITWNLP